MRYKYRVVDTNPQGAGAAREVIVDVTTPRYAKRGHSFVVVYRSNENGTWDCVAPNQEVPGSGKRAAVRLLEMLGWSVQAAGEPARKRRCHCALAITSALEQPDCQEWYKQDVWDD